MLWIVFLFLTAVIFFSGKNLVKYGDILAEKLKLGRTVIGVIFIASITSLPELITGISSVTYVDSADIAAGDILGSCMFNLLILAILDGFFREMPVTTKVHYGLTLSAAFGILLIMITVIGIFIGDRAPVLGWISSISFIIIIVYIIAVRIITSYEKKLISQTVKKVAVKLEYEELSLKDTVIKYITNGVVIIAAAIFLPKVGKLLAHQYELTETFFGTFFVALTTSLPEVAVSIAAARMNMITISVANLLGSNIFNIFILAIDDIFYSSGSIFVSISENNIISAGTAVLMSSVVIIGLIYRAEKKPLRLAFESIALILMYVIGIFLLFELK
ncbi:sodium:calcium antiporter [Persephonella sp.]